jgi:WD40 repeat protein
VTNFAKGAVSLAFLPDGRSLISASPASVRIWNTADWTERRVLNNSAGPITLSSNGTRLATLSRQGVRLWDTATWQELNLLPETSGPIAFSPDGRTLATETRNGGITLWSVDGTRPPVVLQASTNLFLSGPWQRSERTLSFTPDGKFILAARNTLSNRGVFVLSVWDAETGEETAVIPEDPEHVEHTGAITSLVFSPDGRTLATASMDHSIRLWDFDQAQLSVVLQGHVQEVWSLAFSPDGQTLVSGAKDGAVKIWPTRRQKKEDALPGTWQPLVMSKDSHTLAALNRQGTVAFLNLATQEPEQQFQLDLNRFRFFSSMSAQSAVSLSDDLKTMAQVLDDGGVKLWNTESREFQTLKAPGGSVDLVILSPDGGTLITGGRFRGLRLWDLRHGTNTPLATDGHRVIFSPDGKTLATLQRGSRFELRDVATLTPRTNLLAEVPVGNEAAFSRDGRRLAVACSDYAIRLLDVATGELLGTFTGHKQSVASIAFSPDGKTLATASDDSTLKFWNIATQQELLNIRRLGGALRGLLFSPDGRLLTGGGSFTLQSGGLRFYRAPSFDETDAGQRAFSPTRP